MPDHCHMLTLADVIGTERQISIFARLLVSVDAVATRLADANARSIVLAPSDSAMTRLTTKPWEVERDYQELGTQAYEGNSGERLATRNIQSFVEAHIVPLARWDVGEKVQSIGRRTMWCEDRDGKKILMPDDILVERVAEKVSNGEVWVLGGVFKSG